ncbi:MAG: contractile injection system tape measure protein [Bacteroidota bacterium]
MHSQGAHIVTCCQWNTAFDSKHLAHQLQTDISSWSAYKMKRVMNSVFDNICPKGQTLKIKKLAVDLGAITYENLLSELPLRLEEALRNALYELILYPKNGDKTLEIVHEDVAQINVLRDFLLQGILPWNYQETYGTAVQIMRSQLLNNRLDVIQMIQEIGLAAHVRKRIAWQFPETVVKKIIAGLEPNNHQQIIQFSDEFVKVQEKETIVQTSTNDLKKNIWLWILNYLFTERGTIFNRIAFVKSTVTQMASHFNLSYDAMIELIENAIERANEYSQVDKGFIAILKLLSEEVKNTSFSRIKTKKQEENYWTKVETYFTTASARSTNEQKNEFNELVINLSKLDALRFQKIVLNVEQKPTTWKGIVKDLIPAAVENLFLALSPSQSKNVLKQISFLAKLPQTSQVKIDVLDLYMFGIEFCVTHQHASVTKNAFLDFITEKLAQQQQQSKLVILDHFVSANVTNAQKKISFISLFTELNSLYQKEITNTKIYSSEATLQQILLRYATEIQQTSSATETVKTLEISLQKWIAASPSRFWIVAQTIEKTPKLNTHIIALVASYGTQRFVKATQPEVYRLLEKVQQILEVLISKNPKKATALRAIKNELFAVGFAVVWKYPTKNMTNFFAQFLQQISKERTIRLATTDVQEAIKLLLKAPKTRTLLGSAREFVSLQKQYKIQVAETALELTEKANQQIQLAEYLSKLVRAKKTTTREFKEKETILISYLVSNGTQLQKRLLERFVKELSAVKTNASISEIRRVLQELFWQVLVAYESHRGNERNFIKHFEKTVLQVFPELEHQSEKIVESAVKTETIVSETQTFQTVPQISDSVVFEAIQSNLKTTTVQIKVAQKTIRFSELFTIGLQTSPTKINAILQKTTISEAQVRFLTAQVSLETFMIAQANNSINAYSEVFKAILILFYTAKQLGNSQITTALQTIFWKHTIALIQHKQTPKKILKLLVESTFEKLSKISTLDQITIIKNIQKKNVTIPKPLKTAIQASPILEKKRKKALKSVIKTKTVVAETQVLQTPQHISIVALFEAIETHLKATTAQFTIAEKIVNFSEIYTIGLETSPAKMRTIIQEINFSKKQLHFLNEQVKFETFIAFIINDASNTTAAALKAIQTLFEIAKQLGNGQILAFLQTIFWKHSIAIIQRKKSTEDLVKKLVEITFDKLSEISTLDQITIVKHIQNTNVKVPELLKTVLVERHRIFELVHENTQKTTLSEAIQQYVKTGKIELLSLHLITKHELPTWFVHAEAYTYERVVNELIAQQPLTVLKTIRSQQLTEVQLIQLVQSIHFDTFIHALIQLYTTQQKELKDLQKLYETIAFVSMRGISTKSLQEILIKKVVIAWRTSNWSLIASTNIWNELLWETCGKKAVQRKDFFTAMNTIKTMLPTALLVTYKSVQSSEKSRQNVTLENTINTIDTKFMESSTNTFPEEGVAIPNAGLVMLNSYFMMLLDRLGTIKDKAFISEEAQLNSVHYLQYIVTGMTQTEESLLTLNKILVGLSPTTPVKDSVDMTDAQKKLIDGMLQAVINYWPEIGQTSINGFRGNWLVREGILRETEDRWELTVEKRPYDVLMLKSPFSFSIIKLPWMNKPLHVTWPF